jgi:hypothetical protein
VVGLPEPQEHLRQHLGICAGVQQRVNVYLAHIVCAQVSIRLIHEAVGGAGIVFGLSAESCAAIEAGVGIEV